MDMWLWSCDLRWHLSMVRYYRWDAVHRHGRAVDRIMQEIWG